MKIFFQLSESILLLAVFVKALFHINLSNETPGPFNTLKYFILKFTDDVSDDDKSMKKMCNFLWYFYMIGYLILFLTNLVFK